MHVLNAILKGLRWLVTLPILIYQYLISPALPGACIYSPTCSHYSRRAIMRHGVLKGLVLAVTRIFRCAGGLFTGGQDPVPEKFSFGYITGAYRSFWARSKPKDSGSKTDACGDNDGTGPQQSLEKAAKKISNSLYTNG
jgi:hypothetical protein